MANLSLLESGELNQISTDPDRFKRTPQRIGFNHKFLNGDNSESLRAVFYEMRASWNQVTETQYEALRALLFKNELLYLDDGDVPPLIETKTVYPTATYNYDGIENPSSTHIAYFASSASIPTEKDDLETTEFLTPHYAKIYEDDANYNLSQNPLLEYYLRQKFCIQSGIASGDVQRLRIKIACIGDDSSPLNKDGVIMYCWNGTQWIELARTSDYQGGTTKRYIKYNTFDATIAQSLVDSDDSYIRILIQSRHRRVLLNNLKLYMHYVEVELNEGLSKIIPLSHTPVLTAGDVVWVENLTQEATLDRDEYSISTSEKTVTILEARTFADLESGEYFYRSDADFSESGITGANDLTIQGWIKVANVSGLKYIVTKWGAAGDRMYLLGLLSDALMFTVSDDGTGGYYNYSTAGLIAADTWTHIAAVYDASAGTVDFYIDGDFINQGTTLDHSIADKAPAFCIGTWVGETGYYSGGLFNIALFDDKRTAEEIAASADDWDIDLSGEGNLIAQWLFDDAAAAAAIDNKQGDAGRDLVPYDGGDVIFDELRSTSGITVPGDEIEVKYNRQFEGDIVDLIERWHPGDPESSRVRELDMNFRTLAPEIVGS